MLQIISILFWGRAVTRVFFAKKYLWYQFQLMNWKWTYDSKMIKIQLSDWQHGPDNFNPNTGQEFQYSSNEMRECQSKLFQWASAWWINRKGSVDSNDLSIYIIKQTKTIHKSLIYSWNSVICSKVCIGVCYIQL